jgi:eukaryotic-like serine/threonine-protein kinase
MNEPSSSEPMVDHNTSDSGQATTDAGMLRLLGGTLFGVPGVQLRNLDSDSTAPTSAPHSGALLQLHGEASRYQLAGEIARGGMGAVFKGRDVDLGRDIAVKVLLETHQGKSELLQRFVEEAQIAGQLQHPGVVPVYELGQFPDQRPYFTMKLVKGQTLAKLLAERQEPSQDRARFLKVFEQVCQTLAYAHARGVIHRDLKPANVMVGAYGEVQVMDWGLAKVLKEGGDAGQKKTIDKAAEVSVIRTRRSAGGKAGESAGTQTHTGSVLGTPSYMAPEQALGEVDRLDERCDVFGLGALLCQILTGKPPYVGTDSTHILHKAVRADLGDAFARLDGCAADEELVALAKRCLAAEPADRPRDAGVLAAELTKYLEGVETRLRQAELTSAAARARAVEERKRRKLTLALAATVLLAVLLAGGGWLWVSADRAARERDAAAKQAAQELRASEEKAEREREALAKQSETIRQVQKTLTRAEDERAKARTTNDVASWAKARTLVEQAETQLAGVPVDAELIGRVRVLRRELDDEENDHQLIVQLEEFSKERNVSKYASAFADHDLRIEMSDTEAAAWVKRRPAETRERLLAGLDAWFLLLPPRKTPEKDWLVRVLQAADENVSRKELRVALAKNDPKEVERLATPEALARQGPEVVLFVGNYLRFRSLDQAITVLRTGQERFPGDFWILYLLAQTLAQKNTLELADTVRYEEPVRYYTAALALQPNNVNVLVELGLVLAQRGRFDEGVAILRRVVASQPNSVEAHVRLAFALETKGQIDEAEVSVRQALRLQPNYGYAHSILGLILWDQGRYDEAAAALRRANRKGPQPLGGQLDLSGLSGILWRKGRLEEGAAELRKALARQSDFAAAKLFVQLSQLMNANRFKEAETLCQTVTNFQPQNPYGHLALFICLAWQGRFADALPAIKRSAELSSNVPNIGKWPAVWLRETEQIIALEPKLPAYLKGEVKPRDAAERELLLYLCWTKKQYAGAARLYADAFADEPKFADNLLAENRSDAARSAARAGAGLGDGAALDEKERMRLRKQAVDWLRADLNARAKQLKANSADERADSAERLRWWRQDPALASLRVPAALAKLPADEQEACKKLWTDIDALLK